MPVSAAAGRKRCAAGFALSFVLLFSSAAPAASDGSLPAALRKAAAEARVNTDGVSLVVVPLERTGIDAKGRLTGFRPSVAWRADRSVSPASTAKLVTTLVALERLGVAARWHTSFWADAEPDAKGRVKGLTLHGDGDPTVAYEDFALMLDRLNQLGVKHIDGDIRIDRSVFNVPPADPNAFDNRGTRPYNLQPDGAIMNYRNLSFEFVPQKDRKTARVITVPHLDGVKVPETIALSQGACGDWKEKLGYRLERGAGARITVHFDGSLAASCGPKVFNVISFEDNDYLERLIRGLWVRDGRTWNGHAVNGTVRPDAVRLMTHTSPQLSEVTVLVNKWSNNLIARHIFLTLGRTQLEAEARTVQNGGTDEKAAVFPRGLTLEDARRTVREWLTEKGINPDSIMIENGSGLSRTTRVTSRAMGQLLAAGWAGSKMSEYMASLPVSGTDGTMRRRKAAEGRAHLKTGFLSDVRAIGGYVDAEDGRRYAVFAVVEGATNMAGAHKFLDALVNWVAAGD